MTMKALPENPHQPRALCFVQVAFKAGWFDQWNWLHYDKPGDVAFCHVCAKAEEEGKLKPNTKDLAFIQ